ncbi:MAG: hypothetical protein WCF67_21860 [Chitinophagaceae bacterium]
MKPLNTKQFLPGLLLGIAIIFTSCWGFSGKSNLTPPEDLVREEAYVPIYDSAGLVQIKSLPPQPIVQSGKIYVWGNLLLQVEQLAGVHIINYADRQNPVKLGYIQIRGCSEISVKGNYLIANNMSDLVTIDISKPDEAKEVARMKHAFPNVEAPDFQYVQPPEHGKYFVCPRYFLGDVIGWKLETKVRDAYCYY